jgi:hypothetical protein
MDRLQGESRVSECVFGVTVGVAAVREPEPWASEPVLPAAQPGAGLGGDVLDEQQPSVGPQKPPDLGERRVDVGHGAQHERADDRVNATVGQRDAVGRRLAALPPVSVARMSGS